MKNKDSDATDRWEKEVWGDNSLMERSHINRDTYLNCWWPHCEKGLNEGDKAVFQITSSQGEVGISRVSPYLNVLDQESTIHVEDDEVLADVHCPHCLTEAGRCLNCGIYCYDQNELPSSEVRIATACPNEPHIVERTEAAPS